MYAGMVAYDRSVRSTCAGNCTQACGWNAYIKGNMVTGLIQTSDYDVYDPAAKNAYNPRGCMRDASYVRYIHGPTRIAVAAKPALGQAGFTIVTIAAILATVSAINATIFGNSRLGYILAKEGELPKILGKENRDIPILGVILTASLSLIMANSINLTEIAIIDRQAFY